MAILVSLLYNCYFRALVTTVTLFESLIGGIRRDNCFQDGSVFEERRREQNVTRLSSIDVALFEFISNNFSTAFRENDIGFRFIGDS